MPRRSSKSNQAANRGKRGDHIKKSLYFLLTIAFLLTFYQASFAQENPDRYTISSGDILEISVWQDESLSRQLIVPPDNFISFPLIGDIDITGMTVTKLREVVTQKVTEYVPDATVTVLLRQINSLKAYVIGKVNNPGQFPIDMQTNVMQLLTMAGGLNQFADSNKIMILRQEKDKIIRILFNYKELEKGKNLEQNIILQRGDVIVVP
ncbi:MAG: polysaccharide export protein [Deltaproteobacteria bacterium]|nr:polysaccharide export protein [Deltaproteobacteria bacterium]MBW2052954.1 polysaccharide export protein [Deltaproteobacteria bacterium]MBW2141572.1 polysaccharide export protein [Deltaproteobacteria bacterium]MBW2323167.1 polysaccharide export protein [Deltaproteobacteria bacterium]